MAKGQKMTKLGTEITPDMTVRYGKTIWLKVETVTPGPSASAWISVTGTDLTGSRKSQYRSNALILPDHTYEVKG